jgi:hypothetical protein
MFLNPEQWAPVLGKMALSYIIEEYQKSKGTLTQLRPLSTAETLLDFYAKNLLTVSSACWSLEQAFMISSIPVPALNLLVVTTTSMVGSGKQRRP